MAALEKDLKAIEKGERLGPEAAAQGDKRQRACGQALVEGDKSRPGGVHPTKACASAVK